MIFQFNTVSFEESANSMSLLVKFLLFFCENTGITSFTSMTSAIISVNIII